MVMIIRVRKEKNTEPGVEDPGGTHWEYGFDCSTLLKGASTLSMSRLYTGGLIFIPMFWNENGLQQWETRHNTKRTGYQELWL